MDQAEYDLQVEQALAVSFVAGEFSLSDFSISETDRVVEPVLPRSPCLAGARTILGLTDVRSEQWSSLNLNRYYNNLSSPRSLPDNAGILSCFNVG
jgi:hypothetical protein